ncbi:MAG: DUF3341 domain-containing protein [Planctomycetota bacterium]|nr:DUF3341 domain-containing protein [Planctomycetota bacterium]
MAAASSAIPTRRPLYVTESGAEVHALLAEFPTPAAIFHAAEKVRDEGYSRWDCFTPFPVHGLDEAMGIKKTILPLMVGGGAITGATLAYLMQWWMSSADYPLVTQGKPYGSLLSGGWEVFVPITFELGILFSAFTTIIGMLALNGLPRHNHPLLKKERFLKCSDDGFFIAIEAADRRFDPVKTRELLKKLGATHVELVEE